MVNWNVNMLKSRVVDNFRIKFSIQTIVINQLSFSKLVMTKCDQHGVIQFQKMSYTNLIYESWVPHLLSKQQNNLQMDLSLQYFTEYRQNDKDYLLSIIAGEESWCHYFELSSNFSSMQWKIKFSTTKEVQSSIFCKNLEFIWMYSLNKLHRAINKNFQGNLWCHCLLRQCSASCCQSSKGHNRKGEYIFSILKLLFFSINAFLLLLFYSVNYVERCK